MPDPSQTSVDVAIVGGGIAGLALAASLGDAKLRVAVIEARPLPSLEIDRGDSVTDFDSRVSALTKRSMAFLDNLGVWSAICAQRQCPYTHMTVWDADGTGRIEFDAREVAAESLGSIVENSIIVTALAAHVQRQRDTEVCVPARLAGLEAEGAQRILSLDDGRSIAAGLLVAADGALSPTRDLLGMRTREWDYGHKAIVTTAAFERSHAATAWQCFLPTGPLALLPLAAPGERRCSIVWSIDEARADDLLALSDDAFAGALTEASEGVLGAVQGCAPRLAFPLRQRHAVDYVIPGAALVGDAAHTIHPLAGQGINLGLADVAVLSEEILRAAKRGLAPGRDDVLRRYQRRRKGDNLRMMAAMDGFKRLFGAEALPVRWLRNTGLKSVAAMPALKRRIIREAMGVS